jgi:hypothetical protein
MATSSQPHPTSLSSATRGNTSITLGSHIWFWSLKFIITEEGDNLDLVPLANKPANFLKPVVNL